MSQKEGGIYKGTKYRDFRSSVIFAKLFPRPMSMMNGSYESVASM
jgi:hypothetical protein